MKKILIISLVLFSCAATKNKEVVLITHAHLDRNMQYRSIGIYIHGSFWVELIDDVETSYPWDEAIWKTIDDGIPIFLDKVDEDGIIHRFKPKYKNGRSAGGYTEFKTLQFGDGGYINSFEYYYILTVLKTPPK